MGGLRDGQVGVIVPILLLVAALLCAGFAGYGTDPGVMGWPHGLEVICFARRAQVPAYAVCVLCCLALILLVVSGKRRVWWLIGLAPVLALFAHRFVTSPMRDFRVADNPAMVAVDGAHGVRDEDFVVGVTFGGIPHCYSYGSLFRTPVVVQGVVEQRAILVWNPYANLARAAMVDRDVSARELEVVSMPANALLVYNSRYGEFLNGVTFRQPGGKGGSGVGAMLECETTTFGRWKAGHPGTKVMVAGKNDVAAVPLAMRYAVPGAEGKVVGAGGAGGSPVVLVATTRPAVLSPGDVSDVPVNFVAPDVGGDGEPVVVFRDRESRRVRAYLRTVGTGEELKFGSAGAGAKPGAFMVDNVAGEGWTGSGRPVNGAGGEGKWKGMKLTPVVVDEGAYWEVVRYWLPGVSVHRVGAGDFVEGKGPEVAPAEEPKKVVPKKKRRR